MDRTVLRKARTDLVTEQQLIGSTLGPLDRLLQHYDNLAQHSTEPAVALLRGTRKAMTNGHRPQRRKLVCKRCDRTFALPMHLGRHMITAHSRRKKKAG